jgi:predicted DNA-binding transcriptional regulator AlpA
MKLDKQPAEAPAGMAEDTLVGIKAISEFLGLPERQTYRMASTGLLPGVFQLGRLYCGLKSEIRAGMLARARGAA